MIPLGGPHSHESEAPIAQTVVEFVEHCSTPCTLSNGRWHGVRVNEYWENGVGSESAF